MPAERDVFSDQKFAIQVTVSRPDPQLAARVDQVLIGGRPPGLYGGSDKSHLVAWLSFCDGLRADLAGQTLESAIARVYQLLNLVESMPSQALADALRDVTLAQLDKKDDAVPGEVTLEEDEEGGVTVARTPRAWHHYAAAHLLAVRGMAHGYLSRPNREQVPASAELQLLQSMIAAYLHARNTIPLTAIDLDHPAGPPQAAAAYVRNAEATLPAAPEPAAAKFTISVGERDALRNALWGLLDERAVTTVAQKPQLMFTASAATTNPDTVGALAIADHVITMEQAYPRCCAAADLRGAVVAKFGPGQLTSGVSAAVKKLSDTPPAISQNLRAWPSAQVDDKYDRFAVQLEVAEDGTISKMYVGARPRAQAGRHVTAYVALCDYTRSFLTGFPMISVEGNAVIREAKRINAIANSMGVPDLIAIPTVRPQKNLWSAQEATAWFLTELNNLKGSITDTGGTSGGGGEGKLRAKIIAGNVDRSLLTRMLDPLCLQSLNPTVPDQVTLMSLRIALHLYFTSVAYPILAKQVNLVSEETIAELLFKVNVTQAVADVVCAQVLPALRPGRAYNQAAYIQARQAYQITSTPSLSERNSTRRHLLPEYEYNWETGSQQSASQDSSSQDPSSQDGGSQDTESGMILDDLS
jgi:hypothetical protein